MQSLQKEIVKTFFQTLEDIKTKRDFEIFFSDFLTPKELEIFSKRLAVAYWLKKGRNYENIKNNLKVSSYFKGGLIFLFVVLFMVFIVKRQGETKDSFKKNGS